MATEANLEPISEKNLQVTEQSQTQRDSIPTHTSSSLHDTAKGDTLHSTADSILDTSDGEIFIEAPSNDQGSLTNTVAQNEKVNGQELDTRIKEHIIEEDNVAMNVLERGASDVNVMATEKLLSTDETDDDQLEISTTEPENIIHETVNLGEIMESESSKELKLADVISCNPAIMLSTVEESLQGDQMQTVDPISIYDSMPDVHLSTSKNTENNVTLNEEKPTFENSEATQDQHFEDGGGEVDGKMLEKMNSPRQNIDEVYDKGENLKDELQTVLIPITSTERTSHKDDCKDEKLEEVFDLRTDNVNPVDVKTKDDEINKGTFDASSSIELIAEETEKLEVVSTKHDEGQSSEEIPDQDEDDTPLTSLSMPEMSKVDAEDLEESGTLSGTQNEKIESIIEDKDINMMDESTSSNVERNIRTEGVSMTEPLEKEGSQELPEVKIEVDSAPTEDGQECRIENPLLDACQEEIADPERENTCKEELSTTVEENSEENGGKCEKNADLLVNEYQDLGDKIMSPNYKAQENFGDLPLAQDRADKTIREGGEMQETVITSSNDDLKHEAGDNLDQKSQGPETENPQNNSELLSEDPNHRTVDAEATNIDTSGNALEVHAAVTAPFVSQATTVEDIEKAVEHGERTEEKVKSVDNNEDHDKHTCEAIVEVVTENRDHEDSRNVGDSNPEDEQNDENTGVIYMEQMEDENLCKGNELEQENNDIGLSEDSHIILEKSKTEETLDFALEKDNLEDETEYDPSPGCEKLIKEKHIVFIGDIEKDQLEKQEQENYNAHDKQEIVKEKNEDLQETIGEKDEQELNYACEKEILETAYIQDKILVDRGGHGSENTEMVSESGPENETTEQTDETEATRIDKSRFDDNFSNMNIATNDLCKKTTTANEMSESSKANYFVDEETMQEKVHENSTDTVCEENNHNMINDKDKIREERETENSEKVSQLMPEENSHNKISALEAVDIDTLAGGSDLATSQVQEESTQKSTDPEVANEHISSINNDDEGHNTNEGLTKVVVENDIQERIEEKRCMEDELTIGMSIDGDKIESEEHEKRNDLDERKESVTVSDDVEICLDETTTENTSGSSMEIVGSEDKLEKTSDMSEKNKVEISASSQAAEEMDLLEEQEESFKEKDEAGMLLEDAVTVMVTDKASSILDAAHMEYINEVEDDKKKESLKSSSVEKTYGTINNNSIERDPSQKIEFISAPALEDKDPETNEEKETSKIENPIDDDNLKRKISETIEPNDLIESAKDDPTETKDTGNNSNSYELIEETVCCGIDERHREVEKTREEQTCQSTNLIRNTACEEKIDNKKLGISSGLPDDKDQEEIGESAIAKIDSSVDDINSKVINRIAEPSEDIEIVQMKNEENFINAIKESPDNHALVVPSPSEPIDEKYEEASKYELEEQCHQINNAEDKTEADIHKDTENLQILPEKMEIPEIVDQNDDPATVRSKDTLERSIRNTGVLVEKANNNGTGEEQENVCLITNSEDTVDVDVHKEKGNTTILDIDSDMEPEEQGQVAISEKESVKVEQGQNLQSDAQCSIIKEMTNDTAPGSNVEQNIKEMAYEFGIDEQLETTSRSENINDEVHQDVQEEALNKIHENSVSSKNENLAEVDSEREMIAGEAKDVNLVRIACEETKELEEEIPATTFTCQNNERKVVDDIKRGTTTEEVEESKTTTVAQNSETLVEMKSDKIQLPGDASQTMEAKGQGDKTYTTIKKDDSNILDPIIVGKDTKNQDENTNEILDSLPITSALTDEAAYGNLHSDQDGSTIKADYSIDEIPNQQVDSELRSVGQNVEVMIETEPIRQDIPENDGYNSVTQYKELEPVGLNNEQRIANNNNDKPPEYPAFDEETKEEVQNKHENALESSYGDQIHGSLTESIDLVSHKEQNKIKKDPFSISHSKKDNEMVGTGILQNDETETNLSANRKDTVIECKDHGQDRTRVSELMENSLQDEPKSNDGNASDSSMLSQGMEGDELSMASEDKLEKFLFERKEMTGMKEEVHDACPSQVKEPTEDAEVEHISLQTVENERVTVTEAEIKVSDLMSQENLENGLSTTEASLEKNMPESASTLLSEGQSQKVPTHINIAEMIILEDETEEVQLQVQESLNNEVHNEKQEKSEVKADQIESQMNTNDTNEKERQSSKVASDKAKLEEGELEKDLHEVPKEIETTETGNIYKDRIEKQNLGEDIQMDGNELLKDSTTELEGGNSEPIHVSDATEDAIPQEEHEERKCKIVDDLPVVSHKLVQEPKKMETSDHQKLKNTEPEILEKGVETSEGTITQNNEILQTSEKSDADVQNDSNVHVQQLEGLSSTISKNLERAETMEYIEKNSEAEEEAFRAQIIGSLREVTANEQFQGEENDSNKQNKPETNWKSEITITAPNDEVEISEDKPESEEAINANEIDIEIPNEKTTTIECKMVDDLPVVNHQLVEELKKRETSSDHQQMKHPEPEILEKGDGTSEGTITQNNEILEMSAKSDAHLQNDANEHVELEGLSSTISNNLEIAVSTEYLEKRDNEAEEEAFRAQIIASLREVTANEQFQKEEKDSNKQNEPETNWKSEINITVPNDEVEISEDKPESEEALNANELDIKIPKEKTSITECPTEDEKLVCSIGYPASVPGVRVNSEEIPDGVPCVISVTKSSEKDKIDEEDMKNHTEVSISQSHEDRKDISSVEVTESKENTHKTSSMQEPELCQPEEAREMEQLEEEASYGVECDALQDEQTQQIDHRDLPVSQLLMDHILREEVLHTAGNVEAEDDNHEGTDGVKQNDAGVLKGACNVSPKEFQNTSENVEYKDKIQEKNDDGGENGTRIQKEELFTSLTPEQTASTTENKVGQENKSSSPLVEKKKTSDANEKIEIPAVKVDEETYSNLQDSSLIMAVGEDVKDEIPKMSEETITAKDIKDEMPSMSEESTLVLLNDSREPTIKDEEETYSNLQDSSPIMTVAEDIKDEIPIMSEESTFIPSMSGEPTYGLVNDNRKPIIKDDEETHSNLQDSSPIMAVAEDVKDEIPIMPEESTPTEDVKTSHESSHVPINDSKEPTVKDDEETHSNLQDSSPIMEVAEDVKDEITIMSEKSTPVLVNDSREPTSTEERSTETKTGIVECMDPTLVQDEKVQGSILEMCAVEQEINRSVEYLNKDVLSSVAKTYAGDDLLEEGKVIPQYVKKSDEASYAVTEVHYHSNAESVAEKKNLVHQEETLPDHGYDQMSQSSNLQDDLLGQTLEIDPKVKKIEIEEKDGDDFTEIQAQQKKNKSGETTYLSEQEEVKQSNFSVKSKGEILEVTENLLEDRSLSSDEKEDVETKETQVYEDKFEAEKEHKAEESVQDERIVVEARDAQLKPAHKKSHKILSGVGSKVKHSLAKVKKAITGKSSYSKATPAN